MALHRSPSLSTPHLCEIKKKTGRSSSIAASLCLNLPFPVVPPFVATVPQSMAICSRLASRGTASTLFFTNLLRLNSSPPVVAPPSATRSFVAPPNFFYTTAPTGSPNSVAACNKLVEGVYVKNPHHLYGPAEGFEAKSVEEGLHVRVDMPGVEDEDVEVWLEKDTVFVKGEARKEWEEEFNGRLYCGSIDLLPQSGKKVGVLKKDMKNGVLTMVLDACGFHPNFSPTTIAQFSNNNFELPGGWIRIRDHLLSYYETFHILKPPDKYACYYPFQVGGINGAFEARVMDCDHLFLRQDMPGVGKGHLCHKFRNREVIFASDSEESEHNEKRRYLGRFHFSCDCCNITDVKTELKAGVLRMLVSKAKIKS